MNRHFVCPGVYLQLYRGAMRGKRAELLRHLDACRELQQERVIAGVLLHCSLASRSERNLPRERVPRPRIALRLLVGARRVGRQLWHAAHSEREGPGDGRVLASVPEVCFGVLDPEGRWDSDEGPHDDMDEAGAIEMCTELRSTPALCDQPWPMPEQHGDVRRSPRAARGRVFRGYPVDEVRGFRAVPISPALLGELAAAKGPLPLLVRVERSRMDARGCCARSRRPASPAHGHHSGICPQRAALDRRGCVAFTARQTRDRVVRAVPQRDHPTALAGLRRSRRSEAS